MAIRSLALAFLLSVNPCLANIPVKGTEPFTTHPTAHSSPPKTSLAIVFNRETGTPICQLSTVNRQDLVPAPLKAADSSDLSSDLPLCSPAEMAQIQYAAQYATFDNRTAAYPAIAAVGFYCVVMAMAGGLATVVSTVVTDKTLTGYDSLPGDMAIGGVTGGITGGALIGVSTPVSLLASVSGIGAVCGAVGALATNAVFYPFKN